MNKKLRLPTNRRPHHPGIILQEEFLKPMGLTLSAFAEYVGMSRVAISEIVNGRRGITPLTAMRFERALGWSMETWLNHQLVLSQGSGLGYIYGPKRTAWECKICF